MQRLMSRRAFLRWSVGGLGALGAAYATGVEPYTFRVVKQDVPIADLPVTLDGLRLGVLSDIHMNWLQGPDRLREGMRALAAETPDLALYAGDFIDGDVAYWPACLRALETFVPPLGAYAVLGNHDVLASHKAGSPLGPVVDAQAIALKARQFSDHGVRLLHNETLAVTRGGGRLHIAGLGDALLGRALPATALAGLPGREAGEPVILLVHEPDFADTMAQGVRRGLFDPDPWIPLQISGHSHGGQVRLPLAGPVLLPPMGRRYHTGLQRLELPEDLQPGAREVLAERWVFTTVGFGSLFSVRVNCPPEVCVLTLRRRRGGTKKLTS